MASQTDSVESESRSRLTEKIRRVIDLCQREVPGCRADIRFNEPMSLHTTFKVGGVADLWVKPGDLPAYGGVLLREARREGVPVFVLGGGANIVVADRGIRGIVLDTSAWAGLSDEPCEYSQDASSLRFLSGTPADDAAEMAAAAGLSGMEFLAGMPGSIGGAVWMNARCYEQDVAGVLAATEILDWIGGEPGTDGAYVRAFVPAKSGGFGYKKSPFQGRDALIVSACFSLKPCSTDEINRKMSEYRRDREAKGHYRFPSGGSAFKNNRAFGKPAGRIIDELGLKGLSIGGAQVAPFHGNIIINTGTATAANIRALVEDVGARVKAATGFVLEPELLFAGDWQDDPGQ